MLNLLYTSSPFMSESCPELFENWDDDLTVPWVVGVLIPTIFAALNRWGLPSRVDKLLAE